MNDRARSRTSATVRAVALIALPLLASGVSPARAQEAPDSHRWEVSLDFGAGFGGPAGDIERAMRSSGFGETAACVLFCGFSGTIEHPFSEGTSLEPWLATVRYDLGGRWKAGLVAGRIRMGSTYGYHDPSLYLLAEYAAGVLAPVVTFSHGPARVGGGPAVYRLESWRDVGGRRSNTAIENQVGMLGDVVVAVPQRSRIFIELRAQYRMVLERTAVGPYDVYFADSSHRFPRTEVGFSSVWLGIGGGVRF